MVVSRVTYSKLGIAIFITFLISVLYLRSQAARVSAERINSDVITEANAISIDAGLNHSCALTNTHGVLCWGDNTSGQLGDGTINYQRFPVQVQGLTSGVASLAVGHDHTCALLTNDTVKCWGNNSFGQLGESTTATYSTVPLLLPGVADVKLLTAGGYHNCAVINNGATKCWGWNQFGQLGNGTTTASKSLVTVNGLSSTPTAIDAGEQTTCAIVTTGMQCWGYNGFGQLGNNNNSDSSTPVDVQNIGIGVKALTIGNNHTCAVTSANGAKCWGANYNLQLGDSTSTNRWLPVDVSGLSSGVKSISASWEFTCAQTTSGAALCWGKNDMGNLGDNTANNSSIPVQVLELSTGVVEIAVGKEHACALMDTNGVKCWGRNDAGQRGDGTIDGQKLPIELGSLGSNNAQIDVGGTHTCLRTNSGAVKCWGRNTFGQLGDGTANGRYNALVVSGLSSGVQKVVSGDRHVCALLQDESIACWGLNTSNQLGNIGNQNTSLPATVNLSGTKVKDISLGRRHTCILTTTNGVKCWGNNEFGQLGNANNTSSIAAVDVLGLGSNVTSLAVGSDYSCAIQNAQVFCWGVNGSGQLGNNTTSNFNSPQYVAGIESTPIKVVVGGSQIDLKSHSCVLTQNGTVYCWGNNDFGQLGIGSLESKRVPTSITSLSNVQQLTMGHSHTCALVANGMKCWGGNYSGQLGDNSTGIRTTPVDVVGLSSGVAEIEVGLFHSCARLTNGVIRCWGFGGYGQLGVNPGWAPTDVLGLGPVPPPTVTSTPTNIPTATYTSVTPVPTDTLTPTPTSTDTEIPTSTFTSTPTFTMHPSITPKPSFTHTDTPTPTMSDNITPQPTVTRTPTPTMTQTKITHSRSYLPLVAKQEILPTPTVVLPAWHKLVNSPAEVDTIAFNGNGQLYAGIRSTSGTLNGIYRAANCADSADFQQIISGLNMRDLTFNNTSGLAATSGARVYYTENSGDTWIRTPSSIYDFVYSVLFVNATKAYAATDNNLYVSNDSGKTWSLVYNNVDPSRLTSLYFDSNTGILWIGSFDKSLWKLLPNATTPIASNQGFSAAAQNVTSIVAKDGLLYIGTSDGLYRGDGISLWSAYGLQNNHILSLEIVQNNLYAGVKEQDVAGVVGKAKGIWFRSLNGAQNWIQDPTFSQTTEVYDLLYAPTAQCSALLAATTQGIWAYR